MQYSKEYNGKCRYEIVTLVTKLDSLVNKNKSFCLNFSELYNLYLSSITIRKYVAYSFLMF